MSQQLLSTPGKNATSRNSQAGNEKYKQGEILEILKADIDNSTKCGIDAFLKYLLSKALKPDCPERVKLDDLQQKIEDLQFQRYYVLRQPGESEAEAPKDTEIAPNMQTPDQSSGPGDGNNAQDDNTAECATEEERKLVQDRDDILTGLFKKTLDALVPIANDKDIKNKRQIFGVAFASLEVDLYKPFVLMCNQALELLQSLRSDAGLPFRGKDPLDIRFHRSDPKVFNSKFEYPTDSVINRKPDVIITSNMAALRHYKLVPGAPLATSPAEFALPPDGKDLEWWAALATVEFKRKKPKTIPEPAKTFNQHDFSTPFDIKDQKFLEDNDNQPTLKRSYENENDIGDGSPKKKSRNLDSNSQASKATPQRMIPTNSDKPNMGNESTKHTSDTKITANGRAQCASYALEMLSYSAGVHHVINLYFIDNYLWIWYYDRQGILQSDGMCIFDNFPRFLVLLFALQRFNFEDWGIICGMNPKAMAAHSPTVAAPDDQDFTLELTANPSLLDAHNVVEGIKKIKVQMSKTLSIQPHCLAGRATSVVTAFDVTEGGTQTQKTEMVCKISHPEVKRGHEGRIIEVIRQIAGANGEDLEMLRHIPNLIFYGDVGGSTTRRIRSMVGRNWKGDRTLRIVIMKKLQRITTVQGAEFIKAWLDAVICHAFLWKNYVEHGDPSLNNIMYDPETKCGVLCDYDLSLMQWEPRVIGTERTGTVPFMAIDLLVQEYWEGKIQRFYHHELESFIWILTYVSLLYKDGKRQPNPLVDPWRTSDYAQCRKEKTNFYHSYSLEQAGESVQLPYKDFWDLAKRLCETLHACHIEKFPANPARWIDIQHLSRSDPDTPQDDDYSDPQIFQSQPRWKSTLLWARFRETLSDFLASSPDNAHVLQCQLSRLALVRPSFQPPDKDTVERLCKTYSVISAQAPPVSEP